MTLSSILNGAMISGGLIIAIGAQNAFVLKQGLLKNHIFWVSLICFLCDFVLMSLGVLGVGGFLGRSMVLSAALSLLGGLFLFWYGLRSFRAMLSTEQSALIVDNSDTPKSSLRQTVLATLAITLLNPHVYIDTVMLVGGVAASLSSEQKIGFLIGAVGVSFIWFFGIGYGARLLKPLFANPRAWKVLEGVIGAMMWSLAFGLLRYVWNAVVQ